MTDSPRDREDQGFAVLFVGAKTKFTEVQIRLLEEDGVEVDWSSNAADALDAFDHRRHRLVLMELKMPGMSAVVCAAQILRRSPDTEIIGISEDPQDWDLRNEALSAGMQRFCMKRTDAYCDKLRGWVLSAKERCLREADSGINAKGVVAVIDDDHGFRKDIAEVFRSLNYVVHDFHSAGFALRELKNDLAVSVVVMEAQLNPDDLPYHKFIDALRGLAMTPAVVIVTRYPEIYPEVRALEWADGYLEKNANINRANLEIALEAAEKDFKKAYDIAGKYPLLGKSGQIEKLREDVRRLARSDSDVLITGETGSGKENVARQLWAFSRRRHRKFVVVDCSALSGDYNTMLSELFGQTDRMFTNVGARDGAFRTAGNDRGTIFLDQIETLHPKGQAALLRVLETREVKPLGKEESVEIDVRILAASNADLRDMTAKKKFREDLYYRLRRDEVEVPTLRERASDVQELAEYFLEKSLRRAQKWRIRKFTDEAMKALTNYRWDGNVRELVNVCEAMAARDPAWITPEMLPNEIALCRDELRSEAELALKALRECRWDYRAAHQAWRRAGKQGGEDTFKARCTEAELFALADASWNQVEAVRAIVGERLREDEPVVTKVQSEVAFMLTALRELKANPNEADGIDRIHRQLYRIKKSIVRSMMAKIREGMC